MRKLMGALIVVVTAVTLAAVAHGGSGAAKQRVTIEGDESGTFVLRPRTAGPLDADTGVAGFCCWTTRTVTRDGQRIDVTNGPKMMLEGRRGTLVAVNRMEWLDVPGGYALFTGTWKVVRGTGAYAGLVGGGRVAGVTLPSGSTKWRREGLLAQK